jgi:formiminotetrahydrofolate cyclodeaminase
VNLETQPVGELLAAIASKTPAPGGGAVAALTAALGAALGRMVLAYSEGKKSLVEHAELHAAVGTALDELRARAAALADADAEAYARLNALWRLPEEDPRRTAEMPAAVDAAIDVPRQVMTVAEETLERCRELLGRTSAMLASDLAIAAILAEAALRAAAWNVRINLPLLTDDDRRRALTAELDTAIDRATTAARAIESDIR